MYNIYIYMYIWKFARKAVPKKRAFYLVRRLVRGLVRPLCSALCAAICSALCALLCAMLSSIPCAPALLRLVRRDFLRLVRMSICLHISLAEHLSFDLVRPLVRTPVPKRVGAQGEKHAIETDPRKKLLAQGGAQGPFTCNFHISIEKMRRGPRGIEMLRGPGSLPRSPSRSGQGHFSTQEHPGPPT